MKNLASILTIGIFGFLSQVAVASSGTVSLEMTGHSFKAPLDVDNGLSSWTISGASLSQTDFIQIVPSIAKRSGFLFHGGKVETNHFISTFDLESTPAEGGDNFSLPRDQTLAFWYTAQNVSDTFTRAVRDVKDHDWRSALSAAGFALNGVIPPSFSGVGVVFSYPGTITVVTSDGSRQLTSVDTSKDSISDFDFRQPGVKLTLSLNRKRGVVGVYVSDARSGRKTLEVKTSHIPKSGFLGVTAFSGSEGKPDRFIVRQLRSINLDMSSGAGEQTGHKAALDDLVHSDSEAVLDDPLHQIEDINKAISVLTDYLGDTRYRDASLVKTLADVQARSDAVNDLINDLRMEIRVSFKSSSQVQLSDEIRSLKDLISMHADETQSLESLKEKFKQLHSSEEEAQLASPDAADGVMEASRILEAEVNNANWLANFLIAAFGASVLLISALVYWKMRQYEKKHFL